MKKLYSLIILIALITSSCKFEERNEVKATTVSMALEISELIGPWAPTKNENEVNSPITKKIRKIDFKNNELVEIEILDSLDYKSFTGTWKIAPIMRSGIIAPPIPTILIDYQKDEMDTIQIVLAIEKNDLKTLLKSDNDIFTKQ